MLFPSRQNVIFIENIAFFLQIQRGCVAGSEVTCRPRAASSARGALWAGLMAAAGTVPGTKPNPSRLSPPSTPNQISTKNLLHCPKNINSLPKIEPVTVGSEATEYVWFSGPDQKSNKYYCIYLHQLWQAWFMHKFRLFLGQCGGNKNKKMPKNLVTLPLYIF